jgi:hypothetical protein
VTAASAALQSPAQRNTPVLKNHTIAVTLPFSHKLILCSLSASKKLKYKCYLHKFMSYKKRTKPYQ